jgi:hypothetical protein
MHSTEVPAGTNDTQKKLDGISFEHQSPITNLSSHHTPVQCTVANVLMSHRCAVYTPTSYKTIYVPVCPDKPKFTVTTDEPLEALTLQQRV